MGLWLFRFRAIIVYYTPMTLFQLLRPLYWGCRAFVFSVEMVLAGPSAARVRWLCSHSLHCSSLFGLPYWIVKYRNYKSGLTKNGATMETIGIIFPKTLLLMMQAPSQCQVQRGAVSQGFHGRERWLCKLTAERLFLEVWFRAK